MRVFRHEDIISSEIPSDWADLLKGPDLDSKMTKKLKPQLEFDFVKKSPEERVQFRNGAERLEGVTRIIEAVRKTFCQPSEE